MQLGNAIIKKNNRQTSLLVVDNATTIGTYVSLCAQTCGLSVKSMPTADIGKQLDLIDVVVFVYDSDEGEKQYRQLSAEIAAYNIQTHDGGVRMFAVDFRTDDVCISFENVYAACDELSIPRMTYPWRRSLRHGKDALPVAVCVLGEVSAKSEYPLVGEVPHMQVCEKMLTAFVSRLSVSDKVEFLYNFNLDRIYRKIGEGRSYYSLDKNVYVRIDNIEEGATMLPDGYETARGIISRHRLIRSVNACFASHNGSTYYSYVAYDELERRLYLMRQDANGGISMFTPGDLPGLWSFVLQQSIVKTVPASEVFDKLKAVMVADGDEVRDDDTEMFDPSAKYFRTDDGDIVRLRNGENGTYSFDYMRQCAMGVYDNRSKYKYTYMGRTNYAHRHLCTPAEISHGVEQRVYWFEYWFPIGVWSPKPELANFIKFLSPAEAREMAIRIGIKRDGLGLVREFAYGSSRGCCNEQPDLRFYLEENIEDERHVRQKLWAIDASFFTYEGKKICRDKLSLVYVGEKRLPNRLIPISQEQARDFSIDPAYWDEVNKTESRQLDCSTRVIEDVEYGFDIVRRNVFLRTRDEKYYLYNWETGEFDTESCIERKYYFDNRCVARVVLTLLQNENGCETQGGVEIGALLETSVYDRPLTFYRPRDVGDVVIQDLYVKLWDGPLLRVVITPKAPKTAQFDVVHTHVEGLWSILKSDARQILKMKMEAAQTEADRMRRDEEIRKAQLKLEYADEEWRDDE